MNKHVCGKCNRRYINATLEGSPVQMIQASGRQYRVQAKKVQIAGVWTFVNEADRAQVWVLHPCDQEAPTLGMADQRPQPRQPEDLGAPPRTPPTKTIGDPP